MHAKRITADIDSTVRELLADDPVEAVEALFGIDIVVHPRGSTVAGGCGVHGLYTPGNEARLPRIEITQSVSRRRDGFTTLHELGHHLIRSDATIVDSLYDLPDMEKRRSHELVADAIAGRLLVTDADADTAFGSGVNAPAVRELFLTTNASREACCVRAADALDQVGAVMLGRDNVAVFTAHRGTPWTVARDVSQAPDGILARATDVNGRVSGQARLRFRTGTTSTPLFADAVVTDDGWVFAVFGRDRPPAGGLSLPIGGFEETEGIECATCGMTFAPRGKPCVCGDHKCPVGHCSCQKGPPTKLCIGCFQYKHVDMFNGGQYCGDPCP